MKPHPADTRSSRVRRHFAWPQLATVVAAVLLSAAACPGLTGPGDDESGSPDGGSTTGTYWKRNDGLQAWLYFQGSVAKACAGGVETVGTYNSSAPSMTYVIEGTSLTFPLQYQGDALLVGVPDEGVNTNTATWYVRSDTYGCSGSTGGTDGGSDGGGTDGGTTHPPMGTIILRLYPPSGECAKDQPGPYWQGGISAEVYDEYDNMHYKSLLWPSNSLFSPYWEFTFERARKLSWSIFPNRHASMPSYCVLEGSYSLSADGEAKIVTLP